MYMAGNHRDLPDFMTMEVFSELRRALCENEMQRMKDYSEMIIASSILGVKKEERHEKTSSLALSYINRHSRRILSKAGEWKSFYISGHKTELKDKMTNDLNELMNTHPDIILKLKEQ